MKAIRIHQPAPQSPMWLSKPESAISNAAAINSGEIGLPGGVLVTTTMRDLHGAGMGGLLVAFVVALVGASSCSPPEGERRPSSPADQPGETAIALSSSRGPAPSSALGASRLRASAPRS